MDERSRHRHFEDEFLNQLRTRAMALSAGRFPADEVKVEPTPDGIDAARDELRRLEVFDRGAIDKLAGTRSYELRFLKKALGGLLRTTVSKIRVRVLAPVRELLSGEPAGPAGREEVLDALARYQILPRRAQPTGVVLASATGFSDEAKALVQAMGPPTLVLMGGRADGGWDVTLPEKVRKSPWAKLFDLETTDERVRRLLYHLNENASLVDSRGISVAALADKLGLATAQAETLVRQACRRQPRLLTVTHEGQLHVCRAPLAAESNTMSVWSRIRKLLRMKPTTAERVRELTTQRVRLEQMRAEVDQKIDGMERDERESLQQGAATSSDAIKKQLAGKLLRLRKELRRNRAQAQVYTNQIDVIGTQVHHLTLTEQGKRLSLPSAEELTQQAAEAEQVMAELSANAELAGRIEVTGDTPERADEEAAIFAEFEQAATRSEDAAPEPEPTPARTAASSGARSSEAPPRVADSSPPPPKAEKAKSAKPEAS